MTTQILFFGSLKDLAGGGERMVDLPEAANSPAALIDWIAEDNEALKTALNQPTVRIAVDQEIVSRDASIRSPGEIAFMPPFSGG